MANNLTQEGLTKMINTLSDTTESRSNSNRKKFDAEEKKKIQANWNKLRQIVPGLK